jgi:multidrug efflux pump subunit AcrB
VKSRSLRLETGALVQIPRDSEASIVTQGRLGSQQLRQSMPPRHALRQASRNRLRPITMTTLAAILTLLPLAFAIGQGSAIQQPLALAIIAGLVIQYPMVLLAMPVLISLTLRHPHRTQSVNDRASVL